MWQYDLTQPNITCNLMYNNMQEGSSRHVSGRAEKSQFAGFGVAQERDALRAVPAQLRLDQPFLALPHLPSEAASESPSPADRKQVCYTQTPVYSSIFESACIPHMYCSA